MSTDTRVIFTPPMHAADLRLVLSQHSATDHARHQVAYTGRFGETRTIPWLTKLDAHKRARVLKARGYNVTVSSMGI